MTSESLDRLSVSDNIRAEMGRKRITISKLARLTGISRTTLTHKLNGGALTVSNLVDIAAALGIDPADLLLAA